MTREEILAVPEVQSFLQNFAQYCGAPRAVFEGQFLVAVEAVVEEERRKNVGEASGR